MRKHDFRIIVWILMLLTLGAFSSAIVLADEFSSTTLGNQWTWDNITAGNTYSLTAKPGWIRFSVLSHQDTWAARGLMPLLVQPAPKGDFSMETHLKTDAQLANTYGCLVVWKGAGQWIHLELINDGGARNGASCEYWPPGAATLTANIAPDEVYLKTEFKGGVWNQYYKLAEGDAWIFLAKAPVTFEYPFQVGIGAKTWGDNPIVADFDYFRCPELNETTSAVQPDSKLATTWAGIKVDF